MGCEGRAAAKEAAAALGGVCARRASGRRRRERRRRHRQSGGAAALRPPARQRTLTPACTRVSGARGRCGRCGAAPARARGSRRSGASAAAAAGRVPPGSGVGGARPVAARRSPACACSRTQWRSTATGARRAAQLASDGRRAQGSAPRSPALRQQPSDSAVGQARRAPWNGAERGAAAGHAAAAAQKVWAPAAPFKRTRREATRPVARAPLAPRGKESVGEGP